MVNIDNNVVTIIIAAVNSPSPLYCFTIIYVDRADGKVKVMTATLNSSPETGIKYVNMNKLMAGCIINFKTVEIATNILSLCMADIFSPAPTVINIKGEPMEDIMSSVFTANCGSFSLKYEKPIPTTELITRGSVIIW